jgi:hypothetical protein
MGNKTSSGTTTSSEVRELLRTAGERLSAREEKALRMSVGVGIDPTAPLPRRGQKNPEARAELAALELELKRKIEERARAAQQPVRTREKDKIIRALRRLK